MAARLGVDRHSLLAPVICRTSNSRPVRNSLTDVGVAACEETAAIFGRYFRLNTEEVQHMQLTHILKAFHGDSSVHVEAFDPILSRRPNSCRDSDRLPLRTGIPWLLPLSSRRHCVECQAERPEFWDLLWRFAWYPACSQHGLILHEGDTYPRVVASEGTLIYQKELLGRQQSPVEATAAMTALVWWAESLHSVRDALRLSSLPASDMAELLARAWRAATDGPDGRDLKAVAFSRGAMSALDLLLVRLPDELAVPHRRERWFPQLLPLHLYMPALSDILAPLPIMQGRFFVAQLIRHASGAGEWGGIMSPMHRPGQASHFIEALTGLEEAGRLDAFWWAAIQAARDLDQEDVDYETRRLQFNRDARGMARRVRDAVCGDDGEALAQRIQTHWVCDLAPKRALRERLTMHPSCAAAAAAILRGQPGGEHRHHLPSLRAQSA